MPLALPELQSRVMEALLGRGQAVASTALLRADGLPPAPAQRLQVYRNNLFESLTTALNAIYPVVERLVGVGFFRQTARAFIRAHPSRSGNLHEFGRELPAFLRAFGPAASLPYLSDVAALEWACHEVYHEADAAPPLDLARLAAVPPAEQPNLRLQLQAAARLVASPWPVLAIWQANRPGADAQNTTISLDAGGANLLVTRREFEIELHPLDPAELRWLEALLRSATLAEATQAALDVDAGFDLAATLARHIARGLITGVRT